MLIFSYCRVQWLLWGGGGCFYKPEFRNMYILIFLIWCKHIAILCYSEFLTISENMGLPYQQHYNIKINKLRQWLLQFGYQYNHTTRTKYFVLNMWCFASFGHHMIIINYFFNICDCITVDFYNAELIISMYIIICSWYDVRHYYNDMAVLQICW